MSTLRLLSWNVRWMGGRASIERKLDAVAQEDWDVVFLQEVTPEFVRAAQRRGLGASWAYAGCEENHFGAVPSRYASAIATRDHELLAPSLIAPMPLPERAVWAGLVVDGTRIAVCSWHAPNAAGQGRAIKRAAYVGLTHWISTVDAPVIVGMDANHWKRLDLHPERDRPGAPPLPFHRDAWWEENCFHLGAAAADIDVAEWQDFHDDDPHAIDDARTLAGHGLRDVWLEHLAMNRPDLPAPNDGPPAGTSHNRGRTGRPVYDRLDYIYVDHRFVTEHAAYCYTEGTRAGSDHAYITATVRL